MLVLLRKQVCLMVLSATVVCLVVVFSTKPFQPTKPSTGDGQVGFLRRRMANERENSLTRPTLTTIDPQHSSPTQSKVHSHHPPPLRLTEEERKDLANQGILLVQDDQEDVDETSEKVTQAGHPDGQGAKVGHPDGQGAKVGHPDGQGAKVGHPDGQGAKVGHPDGQGAQVGHPDGQGAKVGHPDGQGAKVGHPDGQGAKVGHPDGQGAKVGHPDGQGAQVGHPDGQGAKVGRPDGQGAQVGHPDGQGAKVGHPDGQGAKVGHPDGQGAQVGHPDGQGAQVHHPDGQGAQVGHPDGQGAQQVHHPDGQGAQVGHPDGQGAQVHHPDGQGAKVGHPDGQGAQAHHPDGQGAQVHHPDGQGAQVHHPDGQGAEERRGDRPRSKGRAPAEGAQHAQWLRQVEEQHKQFLKQQHSLQSQHLLQAKLLREKLRQEEDEQGRETSRASATSKLTQVRPDLTSGIADPLSYRNRGAPPMTYEALKKQGEVIMQHTLKREFAHAQRDTDFVPGEEVDPSQVRRVIIVSTWRSGSTYLGDLVRSYPGSYFSFEPLHHLLKNQHLQEGPLVEKVTSLLRGILTCDYSNLDDYINYMRDNTFLIDHNTRLWNSCLMNRALCFDKHYLSNICRHMPVNVLKTVRMGLLPLVDLLQDPSLDLRVIHLVRDPRGSLHSRMQLSWCHSQACSDPETVCRDLQTDLTLSDWMKQSFPDRYVLVRYEDMGLRPEEKATEIFQFLQLTYNRYVSSFVKEHTTPSKKTKKYNTYSTFRDSRATTFAWRAALNFSTVEAIQEVCIQPLQRLQLRIFQNEVDYLNTTIPVLLDA
ncbi:uncharacterized protein [Panulirus ornatus]